MKKYKSLIFSMIVALVVMVNISLPAFANEDGLLSQIDNVEYTATPAPIEEILIEEVKVPMAAMGSWSMINVALVSLVFISSVVFILKAKKMLIVKVLNVVFMGMITGLFMETQSLAGYMFVADSFTVLYLILAAANTAILVAATRQVKAYSNI